MLLFWVFTAFDGFAQKKVSGKVISQSDNEPLPGVTVFLKGTTTGTVTNIDGNYAINVNSNDDVLVFSMVGMTAQEIKVGAQSEINITLETQITGLDEVVVVGYGTMKRSDITGAIASVRKEDITANKAGNALEALQGKIAGADIVRSSGQTGGDVSILIRGKRSLTASNSPLIIVDGIPYGSNIDISQDEIASVEVLKDASSTAIYGSRGANGVILITTKKGTKDNMKITFSSYYGVAEPLQKIRVFNRDEYINAKIDAYRDTSNNYANWDMMPQNVFSGNELKSYLDSTKKVNTDWQELVRKTGSQQNYDLGFSGGNEKTTFSTSLNYYKEDGVVLADNFERYSLRANTDSKINKLVSVGASTIISNKTQSGTGPRFTDALLLSPMVPAYDSTGKFIYRPADPNPRVNPLAQTKNIQETNTLRTFTNFYGMLSFGESLTLRSNLGIDYTNSRLGKMTPVQDPLGGSISSSFDGRYSVNYLWNNTLNFQKVLGDHSITLTAVQEMTKYRGEQYTAGGQGQPDENTLWYALGNNTDKITITSNFTEHSMLSYLSRFNYVYKGKYYLQGSGRFDGASQLAEGHKWDFFPAASVAWRLSKEEFLTNVSFIADLKLRLGYGVTGNSAVAAYSTIAYPNLLPLYYEFGDPGAEVAYYGYRPDNLANNLLAWEKTKQINAGVDFSLLKNRVSGTLDVYYSNSYDLLLYDKTPTSIGFSSSLNNVGKTKTRGIEFTIRSINIESKKFQWITDITFSTNKSEIVELASGVTKDVGNKWFVGEPIDVQYDAKKLGIWQISEKEAAKKFNQAPGDLKIRDIDHNDTINESDKIVLGQQSPKWNADITNRFTFGWFDLSFNIYARVGQLISSNAYDFDPRMYDNRMKIDYWTPKNPTNDYPRLDYQRANIPYSSSLTYVDGSFIKIKHITLGCTFPKRIFPKNMISSVYAYVSLKNPFILHKKTINGMDPEQNGSINFPLSKLTVFGLNFEF